MARPDPTAEPAPIRSGLAPMHPGALFREDVLPALGKSKVEVAGLMRISRQALYNLLDEKSAVTPDMALRLGKICGNGARVWMTLQATWDLAIAERALAGDLALIPTLSEAEPA